MLARGFPGLGRLAAGKLEGGENNGELEKLDRGITRNAVDPPSNQGNIAALLADYGEEAEKEDCLSSPERTDFFPEQ